MTKPCETSGDQADVGDGDPCLGTGDGFLPVFGQPATSPEPRLKPEPKGRFGSKPVLWRHRRVGPLLEVKRTLIERLTTAGLPQGASVVAA